MSKWRTYQLQEIADITMGQSPKGEFTNEIGEGTPLLNGPTEFQSRFPDPSKYTTDPKKVAIEGDVLWCVRGSTVGRRNFADREYAIGRGLASIRSKHGQSHTEFIGLLLDYKLKQILSGATGSTFPNISKSQLHNFEFYLPDIQQQIYIAEILTTFEKKIELNRQINITLEKIALSLYKYWFVDFGPFKEGEFIESELGLIPNGWKVGTIGEFIKVESGYAFKSKDWLDTGIPVIKIKNIQPPIISLKDCGYVAAENVNIKNKFLLEKGDVLIGMTGAEVGKTGIVTYEQLSLLNQRVGKFKSKFSDFDASVLAFIISRKESFKQDIHNRSTGSAQPNISASGIESIEHLIPPKHVLSNFVEIIEPVYKEIVENHSENWKLSEIRNYLLPKLLSGEIDLLEAKEKVENMMQ